MIDTNLVTVNNGGMTTSSANLQEKLLTPNTRSELRPERIGKRLALLRKALDMQPSEISDSLGIPRTYWSRFENGSRALTETIAAALVERYGVTLDFLLLNRWGALPLELAEKMREIERASETK